MHLRAERKHSEPWDASAKTLFYAFHNSGEQLRFSDARRSDHRSERMEGR